MSHKVGAGVAGAAMLLLGGCSIMVADAQAADVAQNDPSYQAGYRDGCNTAHGDYTKNSELFRNNKSYYDGWFAGRSTCQSR